MQSDQQRAIWAVVLSGIVLFLWQYFFVPKVSAPINISIPTSITSTPSSSTSVSPKVEAISTDTSPKPADQIFILDNGAKQVKITNNLLITEISAINSAELLATTMGPNSEFSINFYSPDKKQLTNFKVSKGAVANELLVSNPEGINAKFSLEPSGKLAISGILPKGFGYGISGKSQIMDSGLHKRTYAYHISKLHSVKVGADGDNSGNLKWVGIDYAYHFIGLVNPNSPATDVNFNAQGYFVSKSFPLDEKINSYVIFVKKEYDFLKSLGDSLHLTVDFGMFAFLAVPILWLLKMFYGLVLNFGWAIVLLTILMRMLTFPLQWTSLKGMKKMQKLQPQLAKLKEKYKDDPVAMQKETMEVFKRSGVNPLSGCFPMLLQMPIFFALYSVLYNAVELVGADFVGWIHDLSAKDPYYVLPMAMAVAMFVQQKITPSTITDKMQQKIFLFMPLIFGFFMKDLPSGLSLYIFVSTVSGILQQFFVFSRLK